MNTTDNSNTINARAFRKGLRELRVADVPAVKERIKAVLGIKTKQSLTRYASGKATLDVVKAARIADIFAEYGVADCWGI